MKSTILGFLVASVLALASGCMTLNAELPGTLRGDVPKGDTEKVGDLKIEKNNMYLLWGVANLGAPDKKVFEEEILKQVKAKGGDGVANLKYDANEGCVDLLLSTCTVGIIAPRQYTLTGDIVKIRKEALPGKAPGSGDKKAEADAVTQVAQAY